MQKILDERDILFISDEVICGFGRTGAVWLPNLRHEARLDYLCEGITNGYMPLGGCLVSDKVADVLLGHGGEFAHGLTYSGHPASCAAVATMDVLENTDILEQSKSVLAPHFANALQGLVDHPIVGRFVPKVWLRLSSCVIKVHERAGVGGSCLLS